MRSIKKGSIYIIGIVIACMYGCSPINANSDLQNHGATSGGKQTDTIRNEKNSSLKKSGNSDSARSKKGRTEEEPGSTSSTAGSGNTTY